MAVPATVDKVVNNELFEGATIIFRNFTGKEGQYNREGDRNFCLLLDPQKAQEMIEAGWNVKALRSRDPNEPPQPYIQIAVSFKGRPPRVVIITSRGRTDLSETEVEILDWVDIAKVDMVIRPYNWSVNGKTGVKAYLKSLFITILEDPLELKYNDVPEISASQPAALEGIAPKELGSGQDPMDGLDDIVDAEIIEED